MSIKSKPTAIGLAAIFAIFLITQAVAAVMPAMSQFIAYWGPKGIDVTTISLISTLPNIFLVIGMLLAGATVGKKVSYKALAIIGSALFTIFGCLPALIADNFTVILVARALFGFGLGLLAPLGNALVTGLYDGDQRAKYIGYGSVFMNIGGMALTFLTGILTNSVENWNMCFWGHAIGVVPFILSFFLPEPATPENADDPSTEASGQAGATKKGGMGTTVWVCAACLFLMAMANFALPMYVSSWMQITDAISADMITFMASIANVLYAVGAAISSALFGKIFVKLGNKTIVLGALLLACGAFIMYIGGGSAALIIAGLFIDGVGYCLVFPAFIGYVGMTASPTSQAMGISIVTSALWVGGFCDPYWVAILSPLTGIADPNIAQVFVSFPAAIVIFLLLAVFWFFYNPAKQVKTAERVE